MRKSFLFFLILAIYASQIVAQSQNYLDLQNKLAKGWNTWSYGSMLTHVLLPHGLALQVNLRQAFIGTPGDANYFIDEFTTDTSDLVQPVAHSFDGSYTELIINNWKGNSIRVQSAAVGDDVVILLTPMIKSGIKYQVELTAGMMWNRKGYLEKTDDFITAKTGDKEFQIRCTSKLISSYHKYLSPYLACNGDTSVAFYTGSKKSLAEIVQNIESAKAKFHQYALKYGKFAEAFEGLQTVLSWNTIYDADKNRVLSPVARGWNEAWQGFVLFEWDTYFASFLFALDNKELAYSNAIAMTKGMNDQGFVGQWQMPGAVATGISQPPVGSMICWMIYEKYKEKWFLEEVYNELISWNRWWILHRDNKGFLTWGTYLGGNHQEAAWESGLDNSPMYEDAKMVDVGKNSMYNLADVGLNSLYVVDCNYLAKMAKVLGKPNDEKELITRSKIYSEATQKLWDKNTGIYLNKYLDKEGFSERLSPTLFYPMLGGISTKDQAATMISKHFYNTNEFYSDYLMPSCAFNDKSFDNNYWRGSVWGPMNFLVYLGLCDYDKKAAADLALKSYNMYIDAWKKHGAVFENINSIKGVDKISDQVNCNPFYHWGALMGIMQMMEEGLY